MKKVQLNLTQIASKAINTLDNKSLNAIKGGAAAGDPPPFGVFEK